MKKFIFISAVIIFATYSLSWAGPGDSTVRKEMDASQFVVVTDVIPDAILEMRYYSNYNFIGERIPGYEQPIAILTRQATDSLKVISDELRAKGYLLKIYDAYRPQCAVDFFMKWGDDLSDERMKEYFYPMIEKSVIIPRGFVARRSGHTRGSTIDLTLFDMRTGKEVDMGSPFDYFGSISGSTVQPSDSTISLKQYQNRMILRNAMISHGFNPISGEWWHYTLKNEPFPNTYFEFPVNMEFIKK